MHVLDSLPVNSIHIIHYFCPEYKATLTKLLKLSVIFFVPQEKSQDTELKQVMTTSLHESSFTVLAFCLDMKKWEHEWRQLAYCWSALHHTCH
jgi:hypothetical protein